MTMFERPHLAFPVARGSYVEQGTPEHDMSRARVVIACPAGFRVENPDFGWPFPTFRTAPLDTTALVDALRTFAGVEATADEYADEIDAAIRHMDVQIQVSDDSG